MKPSTPMLNETIPPLPNDDAITVVPLLDTDSVKSLLSEQIVRADLNINSCRIAHIRYKPSRGCTVLYIVEYTDNDSGVTDETFAYARSYTARKYKRVFAECSTRDWTDGKLFGSCLADDQNHAFLYDFPNDTALSWLHLVQEPSRIAKGIADELGTPAFGRNTGNGTPVIRGLRYKPESRLVARMDLVVETDTEDTSKAPPMVLRFSRAEHSSDRYELLQRLHSAFRTNDRLGVPEPIAQLTNWNLIAQKYASGRKLSQVMKTDDASQAVARTAQGLAKLHGYRDSSVLGFGMSDHLARARQEVELLKVAGKEVELQAGEILNWILSTAWSSGSDDIGFVHGDFHQGQVLCDDDRIWLVDFDRAHLGATAADVGNFLAQHKLLQLRGRLPNDSVLGGLFWEQYARAAGTKPDRASVKFWTVIGLLELAAKEFRRLKIDWPHRVQQILTECQATIDQQKVHVTLAHRTTTLELNDTPPKDELLIGLPTLLDADLIGEILASRRLDNSIPIDSCTVSYVRYKPATNCLVAYEIKYVDPKSGEEVVERLFGKCYLQADYQNAVDKAALTPCVTNSILPSVIILEDQLSIIYSSLADRTLDSLPLLFDPRKLVRLLYRVLPKYDKDNWRISDKRLRAEIVRFKPEKRALVRITSRVISRTSGNKGNLCIYARHYVGDQGQVGYDTMRDLRAGLSGSTNITIPEPLAYLPDERILLLNGVQGERLSDLLAGPKSRDFLRRTAGALADLHAVAMPNLPQRTTGDLLKDAQSTADSLKSVMPEGRPTIDKVLAWLQELNATAGPRERFVHGDFYHDQVLIKDDAIVIMDFDRSYRGDPLADVGNFCAHLLLMGRQHRLSKATELARTFVDEYVSCTESGAGRRRLLLWTIIGLFQLAVGPFRVSDKEWRTKTLDILELTGILYHETRLSE